MKVNQANMTFALLYFLHLKEVSEVKGEELDPSQDYKLNFTQITDKLGIKCEVYEVVTEDKYILKLFRLPGDKKRPVFLLSGNSGSADDYIVRGLTSLPAVLAGAGYDVWLGNWRGCKHGRRHVTLDPDQDDEFWNYSYHEFAEYDVPALIDRVLNVTETKRVACISWSLGTTAFYLLGTLRPEYIDKVAVVISLAPFGYMYHSVPLTFSSVLNPLLITITKIMDIQEFYKYDSTVMSVFRTICCSKEFGFKLCMKGLLYPASGIDETNLDSDFAPLIFNHFPSSESKKTLVHLYQGMTSHRIAYYDYGPTENLQRYKSVAPPDYDLQRNNMTIVMISGLNDLVSTLPDVDVLKAQLPNVVEHIILEDTEFNHFDFVFGKNSHKDLYRKHILGLVKKYLS